MPNLNGRLCATLFICLCTHNAFAATLLAQSEWRPGAYCYRDDSNFRAYRMAACDCVGYQGSIGENLSDCPTDSTMTDDACVAGIESTTFSYADEWNTTPTCPVAGGTGMVTRDIKYICVDVTNLGSATATETWCDCNDMDTDWQHVGDASSILYEKKSAEFVCNDHTFSTYCEYQMMDPETGQYTTYTQGSTFETYEAFVCGPTTLNGLQTTYSCEAGYYLKNGTTCTACPTAGTVDGVQLYDTSDQYNTSTNIASCYVPKDSFSVSDTSGNWTWGNDCNYSTN